MADETRYIAAIGPLYNVPLVVVGVAFSAVAWSNGAELLFTILTTFKNRSMYFYALVVASLGVLVFQSSVFCMIFDRWANGYGIIVGVDIGWASMVTGQSVVLWSRLHLLCRSRWKLRAILAMVVTNGIVWHGTQTVCSLLAVENNIINPEYEPFVITEKASLCFFFVQEVIISSVYIWEAFKVLRVGQPVSQDGHHRRIWNLLLANIAILVLDIALLSLEFASLWGVWCTFKGFAYSIKLKIEFVILNQLRDMVSGSSPGKNSSGYFPGNHTSVSGRGRHQRMPSDQPDTELSAYRKANRISGGLFGRVRSNSIVPHPDHIVKTTELAVSRVSGPGEGDIDRSTPRHKQELSPSASEIEFATKGA